MQQLTDEGQRAVDEIARRNGVSADAAATLLSAIRAGGGRQAQFSHPELGGMGQWSRGGMIMIGDMFNHTLKARVDRLCNELADLTGGAGLFGRAPEPQGRAGDAGGASLFVPGAAKSRWPAALGHPSSSGSQNDLHYAVFPETRRLAIERDGRVTVYDTGDHRIGGFSQQQGGDQSITFTSQHGLVRVADLPVVEGAAEDKAVDAPDAAGERMRNPPRTEPPHQAEARPATGAGDDIFAKIERLADLHRKDILTAEEYAAKKAELLGRL